MLAYLKAPNQATKLGAAIILIANKEGIEIPSSLTLSRDGLENLILYIAEREVLGEFSGSCFFGKKGIIHINLRIRRYTNDSQGKNSL